MLYNDMSGFRLPNNSLLLSTFHSHSDNYKNVFYSVGGGAKNAAWTQIRQNRLGCLMQQARLMARLDWRNAGFYRYRTRSVQAGIPLLRVGTRNHHMPSISPQTSPPPSPIQYFAPAISPVLHTPHSPKVALRDSIWAHHHYVV